MKTLTMVGTSLIVGGVIEALFGTVYNLSGFSSAFLASPLGWADVGAFVVGIVALGLARSGSTYSSRRLVVTAFAIIGIATASVPVYASAQQPCFECGRWSLAPFLVVGTLLAPSAGGNGTLTLQILNMAMDSAPITAITLSDQGVGNSSTIPGAKDIQFTYQGVVVDPGNPLPYRATATGSIYVGNVTAGISYSTNVTAAYQDAAEQTAIVSMVAQ